MNKVQVWTRSQSGMFARHRLLTLYSTYCRISQYLISRLSLKVIPISDESFTIILSLMLSCVSLNHEFEIPQIYFWLYIEFDVKLFQTIQRYKQICSEIRVVWKITIGKILYFRKVHCTSIICVQAHLCTPPSKIISM